jgi:hypothetical protein
MSRGAGELKRAVRRACRRAGLVVAGVALALVGAGFLLAAGFMALADVVGVVHACLIVGGGFVLIGGGLLVSVGLQRHRASARADHGSSEPSSLATALIGMGHDLGSAASRNPGPFVTAAFAIGLILGRTRR